jgi:hypothetical protein
MSSRNSSRLRVSNPCCIYGPPPWRTAYGLQLGWWGSWSHDDDGCSRLSWRCQLSAHACVQGILWTPYIRSHDCSCSLEYTSFSSNQYFNNPYYYMTWRAVADTLRPPNWLTGYGLTVADSSTSFHSPPPLVFAIVSFHRLPWSSRPSCI